MLNSAKLGIRSLTAGLALALLAGCTTTDSAEEDTGRRRECFLARNVNSFHAIDRETVFVRTGVNRWFELRLLGTCPDINWSLRIGIRSRGSDWVCRGLDADLLVPSSIGPQRCPISSIRRLSDEEVQAWRASRRR